MLLGVHCSVAGGINNAFSEAERLGIDTFQIFTKNQRQWKEKLIGESEGSHFRSKFTSGQVKMGFSHATYLINLASADETIWLKSVKTLAQEVMRCSSLGLDFTVFHPGSAKGFSESDAIARVAEGLKIVFNETSGMLPWILLENTAGQGTCLGANFRQLQEIIHEVESERLGICLDTCHAFAAGYDIRTKTGYDDLIGEIDNTVGLSKLKAIHLNDSKGALGSRIDRHDHIGKGNIGLLPFAEIMNSFPNLPKVLETPKENNMDEHNLSVLKSLIS